MIFYTKNKNATFKKGYKSLIINALRDFKKI